jgi:hypothetical protein
MAGKRPDWVKVPAHLTESPPIPAPEPIEAQTEHGAKDGLEPTRYGDWERKGICWDF